MGKIKGWKLIKKFKNGDVDWGNIELLNKKIMFRLSLQKPSGVNFWIVHFYWETFDEIKSGWKDLSKFKTRSEALKFAINWMKKHPKGKL